MNISIKKGVQILFIDDRTMMLFGIVASYYQAYGLSCVMTAAADGKHMMGSYHPEGFAFDFRAKKEVRYANMYISLRNKLKCVSRYYDLAFEKQKGNEHIHIEYDYRREQKEQQNGVTVLDVKLNERGIRKMAKSANWQWVINLAAMVLGVILKQVTKKFRDETEKWIKEKYLEALETDNPWDDMFFDFLAKCLDVDISSYKVTK